MPGRFTRALITAPTQDVVSWDEVRAHLRLEDDEPADNRAAALAAVAAAVQRLDPAGGGYLGRALRKQIWELRLDSFFALGLCDHERGAIPLPYPPLITLDSVKYDDIDGVERTLVKDTDFRVVGLGGFGKVRLVPLYGLSWPSARCDLETVRIRYTCGHDSAVNPDSLPNGIKRWVLLTAGAYYDNRESVLAGNQPPVELPGIDNLISTLRVY